MSLKELYCQPFCGHSLIEHEAFDDGYLAGKECNDGCNYTGELKDIWIIGYSVGQLVHNADQQKTNN